METIHRTFLLLGQPYATVPVPHHKTLPRNRNPLPAKMSCLQEPLLPVFNQFKERFNAPKSNIFIFQLNSLQLKRKKLMYLLLMMMDCWNGTR